MLIKIDYGMKDVFFEPGDRIRMNIVASHSFTVVLNAATYNHRLKINKDLPYKGAICMAKQQIVNNDDEQRTNTGSKKNQKRPPYKINSHLPNVRVGKSGDKTSAILRT